MNILIVGWDSDIREGAEMLLPSIDVPSNYKDADKISAYIKKASEKQRNEAKFSLTAGRITKFKAGTFNLINKKATELECITDISELLDTIYQVGNIYGWKAREFLNLAYVQTARARKSKSDYSFARTSSFTKRQLVPGRSVAIVDPIEVLAGQEAVDDLSLFYKSFCLDQAGIDITSSRYFAALEAVHLMYSR